MTVHRRGNIRRVRHDHPGDSDLLGTAGNLSPSSQTVTISETTPGASIYYTIDGTVPQPSSANYTSPLTVAPSQTINAFGVLTAPGYTVWYGIANPGGGYIISSLATAAYSINLPQTVTPAFDIAPGTYSSTQTVTINRRHPERNHLLHTKRDCAYHKLPQIHWPHQRYVHFNPAGHRNCYRICTERRRNCNLYNQPRPARFQRRDQP